MIQEISIKNFRSILSETVRLTPITVLIGANGSGKSNLVKALEFLSEIPRFGLSLAVSSQGGANCIVPKSLPKSSLYNSKVEFRYLTQIIPPPNYPKEYSKELTVEHNLSFSAQQREIVRVWQETLTFYHVLPLAKFLGLEKGFGNLPIEDIAHPTKQSSFTIFNEGGNFGFREDPPVDEHTLPGYVKWLGLDILSDKIKTRDGLVRSLESLWEHRLKRTRKGGRSPQRTKQHSFLDPDISTILDFAAVFNAFRRTQLSIRRYDLLLNELRREQQPSGARELAQSGENMPTVLRHFSTDPTTTESWTRLLDTFESIAPHIISMKSASLRTGKEFIEFLETKVGRGVESWESSDGSLRALAILLAVESATSGDTVVIEEPEQNLHPWAIRSLMEHIREVVEERDIQVVLTTHSQQVLERTEAKEVRVAMRSLSEGTRFRTLDQIVSMPDLQMGEIGNLWVKGLLGGVPSDAGN